MTSHSEKTMWICPKCGLPMWVELRERHLKEWHNDLSAESGGTMQASESEGLT